MVKESTSPSKAAPGSSLKKKSEEESKQELKVEVELSPEDEALKERLEGIVDTLQAPDASVYPSSLARLAAEIQASTSTMTAVPKPLKFLRPHFQALRDVYTSWGGSTTDSEDNKLLADILSVLSMTMAPSEQTEGAEKRVCLHYKLQGHQEDLQPWGHEYLRALAGEIGQEYLARVIASSENDDEVVTDDLMVLVDTIVPHHMTHNAEAEAVDLLLEVQQLPRIQKEGLVDGRNVSRVCLYLLRCTDFMVEEDLQQVLEAAFSLYLRHGLFTDALRVVL
jgi:26S proteasome regulatory subunit N1